MFVARDVYSLARYFAPLLIFAAALFSGAPAHALPSFGIQTDQPCSACHVGAFGPRLKQQGRDFKLFGYVANDTKEHSLPLSFMAQAGFTHTARDELSSVLAGYNANDNFSFNELSAFYAGKLFDKVGAFVEVAYDAIEKSLHWEDFDIRSARETKVFGEDAVIGISVNNAPTVTDMWEIAPGWGFPFEASPLADAPSASSLVENLPGTVFGPGVYGMLGSDLYVEVDLYKGLDHSVLRALGMELLNGGDRLASPALYWRGVWQREFGEMGEHYLALGTYGLVTSVYPTSITVFGSDSYTDIGLDATYQWTPHPELSTSDSLEAHLLYLTENENLAASTVVNGTNAADSLSQLHLEVTYDIDATFTPTLQFFQTWGSNDAARWGTLSGSPNSAGWVAELDYAPWGKPESPASWVNARLQLQYIAYTKFDGTSVGASDNNTLFLNLTVGATTSR